MNNFKLLSDQYQELRTEIKLLKGDMNSKTEKIELLKAKQEKYIKARYVLNEVSKNTQKRFKERVETLITLAIRSVFERPFEFKIKMEMSRNKFSCFPIVLENENEYVPSEDMGVGILDIISFAFRIVMWSLHSPRPRNFFLLDEPMKFIGKGELLERAVSMIREISERMDLQFIIVTHEPQIAENADKAYGISHNGKHSVISDISTS